MSSVVIDLVEQSGCKGYIEDRRPASNCDPYVVAKPIVETTTDENMGFNTEDTRL